MTSARVAGLTLRQAALIAGFAYLLNPVPYAEFSLMPRLVIAGNAEQTVANIAAHHGLFVAAFFCYAINFVEDVVIAWALYVLLAPVNQALSLLAALFRLVYTAVAVGGLMNMATVYRMVTVPNYASALGPGALAAQVELLLHSFRTDYALGIGLLFSIHLVLIGYLIFRSRYMPAWLGVLLAIDGIGWLVMELQPYLYPNADLAFLWITSLGELVFMAWLIIRGWRIETPQATGPAPLAYEGSPT